MKKIIALLFISLFIISCGNNNSKNTTDNKKIEIKQKNFGDLEKFVKANITDKELKELSNIIEERKKMQVEVKEMIKNVTKENKDKTYEEIVAKREDIMNKILPYIEKEKQLEFVAFFGKYNKAIKKKIETLTSK